MHIVITAIFRRDDNALHNATENMAESETNIAHGGGVSSKKVSDFSSKEVFFDYKRSNVQPTLVICKKSKKTVTIKWDNTTKHIRLAHVHTVTI